MFFNEGLYIVFSNQPALSSGGINVGPCVRVSVRVAVRVSMRGSVPPLHLQNVTKRCYYNGSVFRGTSPKTQNHYNNNVLLRLWTSHHTKRCYSVGAAVVGPFPKNTSSCLQ